MPKKKSRQRRIWQARVISADHLAGVEQASTPDDFDVIPFETEVALTAPTTASAGRAAGDWFRTIRDTLPPDPGLRADNPDSPLLGEEWHNQTDPLLDETSLYWIKKSSSRLLAVRPFPIPPPGDPRWPVLIAMLRVMPRRVREDMPASAALTLVADYLEYCDRRSGGRRTREMRQVAGAIYAWPEGANTVCGALGLSESALADWLGVWIACRCDKCKTSFSVVFPRTPAGYDAEMSVQCRRGHALAHSRILALTEALNRDEAARRAIRLPCLGGPMSEHVVEFQRFAAKPADGFAPTALHMVCRRCGCSGAPVIQGDPTGTDTTYGEVARIIEAWNARVSLELLGGVWQRAVAAQFWRGPG